MKKKRWSDYLWIASTLYLALGFFNILFAWLGLICFILPLAIAVGKGNKVYCNKYCGRGQLFELLGGRFGLSRKQTPPPFPAFSLVPVWLSRVFYDNVFTHGVFYILGLRGRVASGGRDAAVGV
jgi:hypothetical protein